MWRELREHRFAAKLGPFLAMDVRAQQTPVFVESKDLGSQKLLGAEGQRKFDGNSSTNSTTYDRSRPALMKVHDKLFETECRIMVEIQLLSRECRSTTGKDREDSIFEDHFMRSCFDTDKDVAGLRNVRTVEVCHKVSEGVMPKRHSRQKLVSFGCGEGELFVPSSGSPVRLNRCGFCHPCTQHCKHHCHKKCQYMTPRQQATSLSQSGDHSRGLAFSCGKSVCSFLPSMHQGRLGADSGLTRGRPGADSGLTPG